MNNQAERGRKKITRNSFWHPANSMVTETLRYRNSFRDHMAREHEFFSILGFVYWNSFPSRPPVLFLLPAIIAFSEAFLIAGMQQLRKKVFEFIVNAACNHTCFISILCWPFDKA